MRDIFVYWDSYWPLLFGVPVLITVLYFVMRRSKLAVAYWFGAGEARIHLPVLKFVLRGFATLLFLFALLGPSLGGRREEQISRLGREVYILLDVSASMLAEDIRPNRLEKVRKELKKLVSNSKGDKFGLIVFTGDAYVQCPLTVDQNAFNLFLDLVNPSQFTNTGTDFHAALSMVFDRYTNTEKQSKKMSRCVILVSDGEDFGEDYANASNMLRRADIHVFPVGVGTKAGAQVPLYNTKGEKVGVKKDRHGEPAVTRLQDESLQAIAKEFETDYHVIDEQMDDLTPVEEQIKLVSASVTGTSTEMMSRNRYQIFLLISFVLLAVSLFIAPLRKRQPAKTEA